MTHQEHVINYLEIQSNAIAILAPKVFRHMGGKSVHQLRVATRRARAALWVLRYSSAHIHFKKLNHNLRIIGKALGGVRELDVAILDANHYDINSSQLISRRKAAQQNLQKLINRGQRKKLSADFLSFKKTIRNMKPMLLRKASDKLRAQLNHQLERHVRGKTKSHQLRLVFKKVRYALEAMGKPIDPIKRLQNILGDAHDLEILHELLGRNSKIKAERHLLNNKAARLVKPAIRFAVVQLGTK